MEAIQPDITPDQTRPDQTRTDQGHRAILHTANILWLTCTKALVSSLLHEHIYQDRVANRSHLPRERERERDI